MDVSWHFGVLNKKGVGATHYAKGEKAQVDTWPANGRKVDAPITAAATLRRRRVSQSAEPVRETTPVADAPCGTAARGQHLT